MPTEILQPEVVTQANLNQVFLDWEQRLARLESEAGDLEGAKEIPEWYYEGIQEVWGIPEALQNEDTDLTYVGKYCNLFCRELSVSNRINGFDPGVAVFTTGMGKLDEDLVMRALSDEPSDGILHQGLINDLSALVGGDKYESISYQLGYLTKLYEVDTTTDLLGIGSDEYSNELKTLFLNPHVLRNMLYLDTKNEKENKSWEEMQDSHHNWMTNAISKFTGMDEIESSEYAFTASRGSYPEDDLLKILKSFNYFGIERVRNISKFSGIQSLEAYTIQQLERMEHIANNPSEAAEELADHDVIVLMTNRVGDHNGVFKNEASKVEDETGRVLYFDIRKMSDIFRRIKVLHRRGIYPTTLVLATHSNKGQFMVSDDRDPKMKRVDVASIAGEKLVEWANETPHEEDENALVPGRTAYSMNGMSGMLRLIDTYMAPSKGIDDRLADKGRKKIIFSACYAAADTEVMDHDENGNRVQIGVESVASQLANDLAAMGTTSKVDVYGASAGIQTHRTKFGMRYSAAPVDWDNGRIKHHAVRVRLQNGHISKEKVNEVPLRSGKRTK